MKNCNFRVKRVLDFILSFVLLIVFLPVLLVIGLAVWFVMGRPIMFCQERPGYKGKIFKIYKFGQCARRVIKTKMFLWMLRD